MSVLGTIKQRLFERLRKKELELASNYKGLVQQLAEGGEPKASDTDRIAAMLKEAGKSLQDLDADVARYLQRKELYALVEQANPASQELAKLDKARNIADANLMVARVLHTQTVDAIELKTNPLETAIAAAINAEKLLVETADPALKSRLQAALDDLNRIDKTDMGLDHQAELLRHQMESIQKRFDDATRFGGDGSPGTNKNAISDFQRDNMERILTDSRNRLAELNTLAVKKRAEIAAKKAELAKIKAELFLP